MPDERPLGDRGRSLEEEYFRRLDREGLDRARRLSALANQRRQLEELTCLPQAEVEALQAHGFTPETIALLPLIPLVQMAWAEGGVSDAERTIVVQFARARAIPEGSVADQKLAAWLSDPPRTEVFADASRLLAAMLGAQGSVAKGFTADELVKQCERIAAASGGVLGFGRIGVTERVLLTTIERDLKGRGRPDDREQGTMRPS